MREGRRCVCSSVAVGGVLVLSVLGRGASEGREEGKEEEHTKSNEKLVIMTIVQTVNQIA